MSKSLEALENLYCACRLDLDYVTNGRQKEDFETIEKELRALEIIKNNKDMRIAVLSSCKKWDEYDLLKEVLL